jgi:hypothetical protein
MLTLCIILAAGSIVGLLAQFASKPRPPSDPTEHRPTSFWV